MTTVVRQISLFWPLVVALTAAVWLPSASAPEPTSVSGNGLWDDLVGKCDGPRNTMDCVRSRLYNYVDRTLDADLNVTDGLKFTRNGNDYEAMCPGDNATGSNRQARAPEFTVSGCFFFFVLFPIRNCRTRAKTTAVVYHIRRTRPRSGLGPPVNYYPRNP